jgi:hypothetical protein
MKEFGHILDNRVLLVAAIACLLAQVLKLFFDFIKNRQVNFHLLIESGGMPSSHSALVTALATSIGQTVGWSSTEFALASIFAIIVMYDAAGVRRAAGDQARVINQIVELFEDNEFTEERLKEILGHTPLQVLVGSILGVAIALGVAGFTY